MAMKTDVKTLEIAEEVGTMSHMVEETFEKPTGKKRRQRVAVKHTKELKIPKKYANPKLRAKQLFMHHHPETKFIAASTLKNHTRTHWIVKVVYETTELR